MIDFTTAMTELAYWDRKPLEQALAYNITLQRENSDLFARILEQDKALRASLLELEAKDQNVLKAKEILHAALGEKKEG